MANNSHLLKEAGMTRKDFAIWLGISPATISGWGDRWPNYAVITLQQYIELKEYVGLKEDLRKFLK